MAILANNFEGGTSGSLITVGNSYVGGDAFTSVTAGMNYSNVRSAHGSISAKVDNSGTALQYVKYDFDTTTVFARTYVWLDTIPTGGANILFFGAGANTVAAIVLGTGRLQMYCSGSQGSSPADKLFPTGQWVRVEMYAKSGSGTGELRLAMYSADSTTPIWDGGLQTGKTVAGGGSFTSALTGKYESTANTGTRYVDDFGVKTGADAVWGAWVPATTPETPYRMFDGTNWVRMQAHQL